ncbi:MAG TPA: ThuA domain-containing protein [Phycisphaerae bacterium]|jgi:type 1 glutamine amidotransferase|nr:ThuA domain-containing protein [Phycisphaerae bacterium]HOB75388.1 ThuA domain-containing protein [Phycisphaerae bacterium]HOJ55940.1 ThuA domain-containing protein [Phycisphaerae bacterium]HOL26694.1 ThuA domain-containing protein [Phycisphaerae bacterium]HPP20557.1 ThuA domain-containing protein [Phycisphaerae bacterium]
MRQAFRLTMVAAAFAALILPGLAAEKPAEKPAEKALTRLLIVTGRDVPAHKWRETTPVLREHLEATGEFEVVVSEEPLVLESSALDSYDVILLNYYNWERPGITPKAQENLLKFVKGGKGLVSFHFSCRAFEHEWPEYRNLIGRIWTTGSGHGPRGKFEAKIKDREHFITQGISDFQADDELYAKLVGDAPIHVLVEAYSEWSGRVEPLVWTLEYGKGRVYNNVFGHDVKACRDPNFAKLLQRGTLWAAGKDAK